VEITVEGKAEPVPVKLGVWLSSTTSRRDKLTVEQRAALAAPGMDWAVPAVEAAPEPSAPQPAPPAAPKKPLAREHHGECDEELYEGGNCTCWSIERFGPGRRPPPGAPRRLRVPSPQSVEVHFGTSPAGTDDITPRTTASVDAVAPAHPEAGWEQLRAAE
jgi:hypothetical protein